MSASVALVAACHKSSSDAGDDDDTSSSGGASGGFATDGGVKPSTTAACATADQQDIYVIAADTSLYQFHPPTLAFTNKGRLACGSGGATPTSMAIDRQGFGWVRYTDSSIWKVDTTSPGLNCSPTSYEQPASGFAQFGMGFATAEANSQNEALYLADHDGTGLGTLDTATLKFRFIGPYSQLSGTAAELTGTGDGKLYGFFITEPTQIAEISKGTGDILSTKTLDGVNAGTAWAFSFYGGDFYVYTSATSNPQFPQAGGNSQVTRYRPSDGSITVVNPNVGFKIVGAGVSTCAPTTLPH